MHRFHLFGQRILILIACWLTAILLSVSVYAEIVFFDDGQGNQWRLEQYITTHLKKGGGDGEIGGVPEWGYFDMYYGKDCDVRWMNLDKDGHPWDDTIKPAYNNYHNKITAYNEIKIVESVDENGDPIIINDDNDNGVADDIEAYEQKVFNETGVHCDLLNYNPFVPVNSYLWENHSNIQILNNVIVGSSLFTVIFPPYWEKSNQYPILLAGQGYGADNNAMYLTKSTYFAGYVAESIKNGGNGIIGVRSNCGGRESLGLNEDTMNDVGMFLKNVLSQYGGDIDRVALMGASRAGSTALVWGANPNASIYDYNVLSIHSYVSPLKIGSMFRLSRATFPSLNGVDNKALGSESAYSHYYVDEDAGAVMTPEEKARAVANVFLGVTSLEEADSKSAYGYYSDPVLIPFLQQKRILIAQGTHDCFMPMPYFLDFDHLLTSEHINHRTVIGYCFGHRYYESEGDEKATRRKLANGEEIVPFPSSTRVFSMPASLINEGDGTKRQGSVKITDALISEINTRRPGYFKPDHDETTLAFSATLPYRVGHGLPMTITLMGEEGKSWKMWTRKENGYKTVYEREGVFGQSINKPDELEYGPEWVIVHLNVNAPAETRYEWFFEYDGQEIPNRFTPYISPQGVPAKAVLEVTADEPGQGAYWHDYEVDHDVNFGVDQYHPLLLTDNAAPVVNPLDDITVHAGEQVTVVVDAVDPDPNAELVYDLRGFYGNYMLNCTDGNGLTGEFVLSPGANDIGVYTLKAIAKDGLGGVGDYVFTVTVQSAN